MFHQKLKTMTNFFMLKLVELTDNKVNGFTDSMIEDIQDIIKIEFPDVIDFNHGILPPRYKELKEELKVLIHNYIYENAILEKEFVETE